MILVDQLKRYQGWPWPSCHMGSDTSPNELLKFGLSIGLKLSWVQAQPRPHFDLSPKHRRRALAAGAVEVTTKEFLRRVPRAELTR